MNGQHYTFCSVIFQSSLSCLIFFGMNSTSSVFRLELLVSTLFQFSGLGLISLNMVVNTPVSVKTQMFLV